MDLLTTAVQLPRHAEIHQAAIVDAVDGAAQLDVLAAQSTQIADVARVFGQAGDGEAAVFITGRRGAGIQEARAVTELCDVVDMSRYADVLARVPSSFRRRMAACGVKPQGKNREWKQSGDRTHAARLCLP